MNTEETCYFAWFEKNKSRKQNHEFVSEGFTMYTIWQDTLYPQTLKIKLEKLKP